MNAERRLYTVALLLGLAAAAPLAQGRGRPQQTGAEAWMKMEKELGLQTEYAVDMEIQAMGMTMASKTYRHAGQTRTETTVPFMNMRLVALELIEGGQSASYSLFPDKKKYCLNEAAAGGAEGRKPEYTVSDAGTEVYEGVTCKKRRVTVKLPDGQVQELDMLFSPAQKNMPVKMAATVKVEPEPGQPPMTVNSVVLFKNYVFAAPADSLFVIPKDYVRAKDMNEVMMGSLAGFGAPPAPPAAGQAPAPAAAGQPDIGALIRQAQEEAAREAAKEAAAEAAAGQAPQPPAAPGVQEGLRNLRRLLGN